MASTQEFPIRYGVFRPLLSVLGGLGVPVKLRTLQVSVEEPEKFLAALSGARR